MTSGVFQTSRLLLLTQRKKKARGKVLQAKVGFIGNKDFLLTDIGNWNRGNDCKQVAEHNKETG